MVVAVGGKPLVQPLVAHVLHQVHARAVRRRLHHQHLARVHEPASTARTRRHTRTPTPLSHGGLRAAQLAHNHAPHTRGGVAARSRAPTLLRRPWLPHIPDWLAVQVSGWWLRSLQVCRLVCSVCQGVHALGVGAQLLAAQRKELRAPQLAVAHHVVGEDVVGHARCASQTGGGGTAGRRKPQPPPSQRGDAPGTRLGPAARCCTAVCVPRRRGSALLCRRVPLPGAACVERDPLPSLSASTLRTHRWTRPAAWP